MVIGSQTKKMLLLLFTILCTVGRSSTIDVTSQLFPVPQFITVDHPTATRSLSASFAFETSSKNEVVLKAITRYTNIIQKTNQKKSSNTIDTLVVTVADDTPTMPTLELDVSYALRIDTDTSTAIITATTPFGALYGIETFSQMVNPDGVLLGDGIAIKDAPSFRHRGLTIDVGRRIAPIDLVNSIIDGLSYSKMNVLHMSLSGPTVRVEMPNVFPELTAWLEPSQYYTQSQIRAFVERARLRGVIIVPEIDIPAHASGFFPLTETRALQFCDADRTTLNNDPNTLTLVLDVFDEIVKLFPSQIIHIGGDEALPKGNCTFQSIHDVEIQVQKYLIDTHSRTPMGWNEVFSSPQGGEPNGAIKGKTILQNWKGTGDADTVAAGFVSVDSQYKKLYENEQCCRVHPSKADGPTALFTQCFWTDVTQSLTAKQRNNPTALHMLAGGEAAMWSDEYCPSPLCAINGTYGWMSDPKYDTTYVESFGKQVFPNAAATGASLWNFLNDTALPGDVLASLLDKHNNRMIARGVVSCPVGCHCDWGESCGIHYLGRDTKPNLNAVLVNKTPFDVKVKRKSPCNRTTGEQIALIAKGENFTVTDDFIVEAIQKWSKPTVLVGDPFDLWVGDSTWMDIEATFHITYDESIPYNNYLDYEQVDSSAAKEKTMYVILKSEIMNEEIYIKEKHSNSNSIDGSSLTLCHLKMFGSTCLVRKNFVGEIINSGSVIASSDTFSTWWGDNSYNQANTTMVLTRKGDKGSYITMTNVGFQ